MKKTTDKIKDAIGAGETKGLSRRKFMKNAALGAGGAAAATAGATFGNVPVEASARPIMRPDNFEGIEAAPVREFKFPASGADVFARACQEEELAALFCCPGNYGIISALANQGIPPTGAARKARCAPRRTPLSESPAKSPLLRAPKDPVLPI